MATEISAEGLTRRAFLWSVGTGSGGLAAGAAGGFGASQAYFQPDLEELLADLPADPYWNSGIWKNNTEQLRRPDDLVSLATPSGPNSAASFLPPVHADTLAQAIELYYFDETERRFRLPYNLPLQPRGQLRFTAALIHFNPSTAQFAKKKEQATLRIDVADRSADTPPAFDLLLSGLKVYEQADQKQIPGLGRTFFTPVEEGKQMVLKSGVLQVKFHLWRHKPESIWSKLFAFAKQNVWPLLTPFLPLPNLITAGVGFVNETIGFAKNASKDQPVWESGSLDLVVTEEARDRLGWPYGFRKGYWVVTDKNAPNLASDKSDVILDAASGYLVSRTDGGQRALLDHNYLLWYCNLTGQ